MPRFALFFSRATYIKIAGLLERGRIRWYWVPSVIRMSSIWSLRLSATIAAFFARTTSVFAAPAASRSKRALPPSDASIRPDSLSTKHAPITHALLFPWRTEFYFNRAGRWNKFGEIKGSKWGHFPGSMVNSDAISANHRSFAAVRVSRRVLTPEQPRYCGFRWARRSLGLIISLYNQIDAFSDTLVR